jgi:tetratricopeptide (TPR) repeat protein
MTEAQTQNETRPKIQAGNLCVSVPPWLLFRAVQMKIYCVIALLATSCLWPPLGLCEQSRGKGSRAKAKTESSASPTESTRERPSHFESAERLFKEGRFLESIEEYKLSLEDYPENEAAYFGMALAQAQAGLSADAIQSYEAALKINPKLWEAETNLGILWVNQKRFDRALSHFQKAQEVNPKNFQISFFSARSLEALGRLQDAVTQYRQALALAQQPSDKFDVHLALGQIFLKTQLWNEAEQHLLAARQSRPDAVGLDLELAQLYFQSGKYNKCVELLQPLAEQRQSDAEIQELLGRAHAETGAFAKAAQALELGLSHQKDGARRQALSLALAQAYQELSQPDKAISLLQSAAATSADSKLHFHLGTVLLQQRDLEAAARSFLRALHLEPSCIDCYSNLGSVLMLQEKYAEAIAAFSQFKTARPTVAGTYFYMGLAFDKLNDVEKASEHYQKFLELDQGKSDKQDFQAKERLKVLEKRLKKR